MPQSETVVSQHLQDSFLFLAITSKEFLAIVRTCLLPHFFTSPVAEEMYTVCLHYYDLYKDAPKDHFHDELIRVLAKRSEDDREQFSIYEQRIGQLHAPSFEYVIRRVSEFVRAREFGLAAVEFARLVERGKFPEAQSKMYEALRSGIAKENIGTDYNDAGAEARIRARGIGPEYLVSTGVPFMDKMIGGLRRQQLVCLLGTFKGKKSWAGMNIIVLSMGKGLNCLHVSHEMNVDEIEARYDMMFGALASTHGPLMANLVELRGDFDQLLPVKGAVNEIVTTEAERPTIYDQRAALAARKAIKRMGGRLIIKKYPMGSCDMNELQRYLDYLEVYEGFVPDIIVNDYPEIMKRPEGMELRHQINEIYIQCKRVADERDLLMVVMSQATRAAIRSPIINVQHFAEDIRKAGNIDVGIAICQTDVQLKHGEGTYFCCLHRTSANMGRGCRFWMNLDIGQFCQASARIDWFGKGESVTPEDVAKIEEGDDDESEQRELGEAKGHEQRRKTLNKKHKRTWREAEKGGA